MVMVGLVVMGLESKKNRQAFGWRFFRDPLLG